MPGSLFSDYILQTNLYNVYVLLFCLFVVVVVVVFVFFLFFFFVLFFYLFIFFHFQSKSQSVMMPIEFQATLAVGTLSALIL